VVVGVGGGGGGYSVRHWVGDTETLISRHMPIELILWE